jgi:hypothetical protein
MAEWKKVLVSGSNIHVNQITASGLTQVSKPHVIVYDTQSGAFHYTASSGVGDNIFIDRTTYYDTINTLRVTGSTLQASPSSSGTGTFPTSSGANNTIYAFLVSESIYSHNHNVGYPTANSWKESLQGSYFNNFDANTNVSEVLRFIAGLLSQSAPDASPNTRTFASYSVTVAGTQGNVSSIVPGYIPFSSTNDTVKYLVSRGFSSASQQLFSAYGAGTNMYIGKVTASYTSGVGGTTTVSSSNDSQLFGLGTLAGGNPSSFTVSASFTHRFFNTQSTATPTEVSSSNNTVTQTGAGTTSGVTLAKINTANPAVIPPNFQDGKFVSVLTQTLYSGSSPLTISASGYYHISSSFRISSGSSTYTAPTSSNLQIFYAPLNLIVTNVPAQTVQTSSISITHVTATSRSLSGAPYLTGSTYILSSSLSRSFSPLYSTGSPIAEITDAGVSLSKTGLTSVVNTTGQITTANAIWDSTNTTYRGSNVIPFENDIIRVNALYTFAPTNGVTNLNGLSSGLGTTTFTSTVRGYDRGNNLDQYVNTINYHTAGTFGQPVSSGSLGYYGRAQGYDSGSISGSREIFVGETFRLKISSSILSGSWANGEKFVTSSFQLGLGPLDLQVKPNGATAGYLVRPGGSYGYWLGDPDSTKDYKFYARAFQTDGTTKSKLTIDIGRIVTPWHVDTNTTCSIAVMFESAQAGIDTGGGVLARAVLYDPSVRTTLDISSSLSNDNFRNPFTPLIDLKGNNQTGNDLTGTVYTMPLTTNLNQVLNSTYKNFIVLVRYKGDPSPISYIQVGY